MQAEIIAIGDELTSGQRLDTNSQWLSQRLGEIGIRTLFHTTVADDLEANLLAFRQAAGRVDVVICTGGLGPTADDLTREAMAAAFDCPLVQDHQALAQIRELFASRGREMPARNQVQAMFPEGSVAIENPHGTAPGIQMSVGARPCHVFALPGVPVEMREMWAQSVGPTLQRLLGQQVQIVRHFRLKCFGTGESALEEMLPDLIRRGREPTVGITVSQATITLRITAQGADEAACQAQIAPTAQVIRDCLGDLVYGEEDDELEHAVARLLRMRRATLALSEWGSGGLISDWLHRMPDAPRIFLGSKVVASAAAAATLLDVDPELAAAPHTEAMAAAIRARTGADFGLAVGAFPPSTDDPQSRVFLGLATPEGTQVASRRFAGHPEILRPRAAKQALDLLRLHLLSSSASS